ncbi:hypothetical protein EC844_11189 [Acinetobacter calcoaceticus]|uniref:Uncharacterized protein n=1 Tax=Acinetobacter calcoaceticus TaxID=471 RepID=A0A4R1XT87_ACICA|nr:hypothetical protein EC844_11189 [Acinetobacter calcoaceticus]
MKSQPDLHLMQIFQQHPRFPFQHWDHEYDDYCAMNLMFIYMLKFKRPASVLHKWEYLRAFDPYRIKGAEGIFYPFACVNHATQQVFTIGIPSKHHAADEYANLSISTVEEPFYFEVFKDRFGETQRDYYHLTSIYFDPTFEQVWEKVYQFLDLYFAAQSTPADLINFNGHYVDKNFQDWIQASQ